MPNHLNFAYALLAALVSSVLFIAVFGIGLGFIFMFLPTLPLFALGLSHHARMMSLAVWTAFGLIMLVAGLESAILFMGFLGVPAWYLAKGGLIHAPLSDGKSALWVPIGNLLTWLTICACGLVALITAYYAFQAGGLPHLLSQNIHEAFQDLREDYGNIIDALADRWSFLVFSITIWLWGLSLYAHAWLVNRVLSLKGWNIRPDFSITVFVLPHWLPSLLAICALASLIGGPSMSFLGKTTLISLLLPYFFQGCALMHLASWKWPSRRFFLFFIYFMVFAQFWPALIISGLGLWHQIKHLSGSGSWFKS